MSGSFQANHQEMADTAGKTGDKADDADSIKSSISEAQVPSGSWGLVGKITEGKYATLLSQLNDHMDAMSQGIANLAGTIQKIATNYKENEDSISDSFSDIDKEIGEEPAPPTPSASAGEGA
ncbi:MAG TPA: hypothetical protein VHX38_33955 [Pseudonocardiaceae bacterium]|nr:hypothetical protein [Pseudonocardiaceae bacterium]